MQCIPNCVNHMTIILINLCYSINQYFTLLIKVLDNMYVVLLNRFAILIDSALQRDC